MDVNRLINMIAKLAFAAIAKFMLQRWRKSSVARTPSQDTEQPADRDQAAEAKALEKRARDTAKLMRRLGR